VPSKGSGNNLQHYETWDNAPLEGLQYYYLIQYDYDNTSQSYGPVPIRFEPDGFDIITTSLKSTEQGLNILFHYDSEEPVSLSIIDMTGRPVVEKNKYPALPDTTL